MSERSIFLLSDPDFWPGDIVYGNVASARYAIHDCEVCLQRWRGKQQSNFEIELFGTELSDFVWSDAAEIIMPERTVDILFRNKLKGFKFLEVTVMNSQDYPEIGCLYQMIVTGTAGRAADTESARLIEKCDACGRRRYAPPEKIDVLKTEWDRSDIFLVEEFPKYHLIADRFLGVLRTNSLSNFQAIRIGTFVSG